MFKFQNVSIRELNFAVFVIGTFWSFELVSRFGIRISNFFTNV